MRGTSGTGGCPLFSTSEFSQEYVWKFCELNLKNSDVTTFALLCPSELGTARDLPTVVAPHNLLGRTLLSLESAATLDPFIGIQLT